ncbi:MAG TPA: hypothetical protein VNR65_02505, partial [Geobacterales bacterium]|nr:hypothetical protein [Geobacterales bacterium]
NCGPMRERQPVAGIQSSTPYFDGLTAHSNHPVRRRTVSKQLHRENRRQLDRQSMKESGTYGTHGDLPQVI